MSEINEGLFFEGTVPLQMEIIESYPKAFQLSRINHSNEMLLRASLMLDEASDIDEGGEFGQALVRHEIKLNLIVDILGELISAQFTLPPEQEVQLTTDSLTVLNPDERSLALKENDFVRISLFITPELPKPVVLLGCIRSVETDKLSIGIEQLNMNARGYLEKIIFRYHRRKIAASRGYEK